MTPACQVQCLVQCECPVGEWQRMNHDSLETQGDYFLTPLLPPKSGKTVFTHRVKSPEWTGFDKVWQTRGVQNRGACRPPKFRPDEGLPFFLFPLFTRLHACLLSVQPRRPLSMFSIPSAKKLCNPEDLCTNSTAFNIRTIDKSDK